MMMWMLVRGVEDKLEHVTTSLQEMATMNQGVNENDFVGRSMNDFLNIYGTVKEYYDAFKSRDGIILLEQCCVGRSQLQSQEKEFTSTIVLVIKSFEVENISVDNVRCDEDELKVGEMDDNINSKEVEKGSIEFMGYE
nr:hypothetical protein [Tanacetum cinerariifolium]